MLLYDLPVLAFTAGVGCHGTEPGIDARETGLKEGDFVLPPSQLLIPRQTHSTNVAWVDHAGEVADTDSVITDRVGLCLAVKTADCIPVLLYDSKQHLVAAVHAGWRGTVGRIVEATIRKMGSKGDDLQAIIGPGISLEAFEVGHEVYDAFQKAKFPMELIAKRFPTSLPKTDNDDEWRWHIDLWEANRQVLLDSGVSKISVAGICTKTSQYYYSARRDTIRTGRNINGIMMLE